MTVPTLLRTGQGLLVADGAPISVNGRYFDPTLGMPRAVQQLSDFCPSECDPFIVENDLFTSDITALRRDTFVANNPDYSPDLWNLYNTNSAMWVEMGRDDNVEIGLTWQIDNFYDAIHQVGPVGFVDPTSRNELRWGLTYNSDVSLFYPQRVFFGQNIFHAPAGQNFNQIYYESITGSSLLDGNWTDPVYPQTMVMRMRAAYGRIQFAFWTAAGGWTETPALIRPEGYGGRDGWGIRTLSVFGEPGTASPYTGGVWPALVGPKITNWYVREYDTLLV